MKIKTVEVTYGETCSLPEYSNVKVAVTVSADLEEGDSLDSVQGTLMLVAKHYVRNEIDDALEDSGRSPKHDTDELFQIFRPNYTDRWRIIAPDGTKIPGHYYSMAMRFPAIQKKVDKYMAKEGGKVFAFSAGVDPLSLHDDLVKLVTPATPSVLRKIGMITAHLTEGESHPPLYDPFDEEEALF